MKLLKMKDWSRALVSTGLTIALGAGIAVAQTAGQDMKDAGHDTKNAAVDVGHGTKKAAVTTGHKTKHIAKKTGHATKKAAVATGHRTENVGDAMAGKQEKH